MKPAHQTREEDAALIARWRQGSAAAWGEVLSVYRPLVYSVALRLLRDPQDAEEITNDAFLSAFRNLAGFEGKTSLASWLYCISKNKALNRYHYWRRRHRRDTITLDAPVAEGGPLLVEVIPDQAPGIMDELHFGEQAAAIARAMEDLPPAEREIIAAVAAGTKYREIAEIEAIHLGTVKSRVARARDKLRRRLAA